MSLSDRLLRLRRLRAVERNPLDGEAINHWNALPLRIREGEPGQLPRTFKALRRTYHGTIYHVVESLLILGAKPYNPHAPVSA